MNADDRAAMLDDLDDLGRDQRDREAEERKRPTQRRTYARYPDEDAPCWP